MNDQLSQAYDIDNRRAGTFTLSPGPRTVNFVEKPLKADDNSAAKRFLGDFIELKRDKDNPNMTRETASEGRFDFGSDGNFRNLFRAT